MKGKHAYLIMAHNDFYVFEKLLLLLDHPRNDLYIHIDKKVKSFHFEYFQNLCKESTVVFTDRLDVRWGDFSQIQCELLLLKQATKKKYDYYHLISGVDLPLKSNEEIHQFFDQHRDLEFVHFAEMEGTSNIRYRVGKYHFMPLQSHRNKGIRMFAKYFENGCQYLQNLFSFQRKWDPSFSLAWGANWFSITDNFATYLLEQEEWIYQYFPYTSCGDELFLQILLYNSPWKEKLYVKTFQGDYSGCMRYIDWKRGNPYVWKKEDYQELMETEHLWARKFSSQEDHEIVDMIYHCIKERNSLHYR